VSKKSFIDEYGPYIYVGAEMAVGISLPILIGHWLDDYFGTAPWLVLIGCVVGITNVIIIIIQLQKRLKDDS